jgi:hypothetical protein
MRRYGLHSRCLFHDSRRPVIWLERVSSMVEPGRFSRTLAHESPGVAVRSNAVFLCPVAAQRFFANVPTNRGNFD